MGIQIAKKKGGDDIMGRKDTEILRVNKEFAEILKLISKKTGKSINEITKELKIKIKLAGGREI